MESIPQAQPMAAVATPAPTGNENVGITQIDSFNLRMIHTGLILLFIGIIIIITGHFIMDVSPSYIATVVVVENVGIITQAVGALLMCYGLTVSALRTQDIDSNFRSSLLLVAGLIIASEIIML